MKPINLPIIFINKANPSLKMNNLIETFISYILIKKPGLMPDKFPALTTETVANRRSIKKVFLKISQ